MTVRQLLAMNKPSLEIDDIVEMINLPKSFVYEHTRTGSSDPIPSYRFGKHLRFSQQEIEKWIEEHRKK
jgi:excisionase family DNA binding protein